MKPELQLKACAELDGWKLQYHNLQGENWVKPNGDIVTLWADSTLHDCNFFPNYLTSYDAIIPLIQKQDKNTLHKLLNWLVFQDEGYRLEWSIFATPQQLVEALLRATGKWIE